MQNALLFLADARRDGALRCELEQQQDDAGVLCSLGRSYGYNFGLVDLQQAFGHQWALRALHGEQVRVQR